MMNKIFIILSLLISTVSVCFGDAVHVYGSLNEAYCPVTGLLISDITNSAHYLDYESLGQKIYFANEGAIQAFILDPRAYLLNPYDLPPEGDDAKRGIPDLFGQTLICPVSNDTIAAVDQMTTVRSMYRHGQMVYFCCYDCWVSFIRDPGLYISQASSNPNPDLLSSILVRSYLRNWLGISIATTFLVTWCFTKCMYDVCYSYYRAYCCCQPNGGRSNPGPDGPGSSADLHWTSVARMDLDLDDDVGDLDLTDENGLTFSGEHELDVL